MTPQELRTLRDKWYVKEMLSSEEVDILFREQHRLLEVAKKALKNIRLVTDTSIGAPHDRLEKAGETAEKALRELEGTV